VQFRPKNETRHVSRGAGPRLKHPMHLIIGIQTSINGIYKIWEYPIGCRIEFQCLDYSPKIQLLKISSIELKAVRLQLHGQFCLLFSFIYMLQVSSCMFPPEVYLFPVVVEPTEVFWTGLLSNTSFNIFPI
jgi:hypothetical protein